MLALSSAFADIHTGSQFRELVAALPDDNCKDGFFESCLSPIVYSRHHWLQFKGEYRVRADLRRFLDELRLRDPRSWDDEESDFVLSLFALFVAEVGLDELTDRVDTSIVRKVIQERFRAYTAVVSLPGEQEAEPAGLIALAERVTALRALAGRSHLLFSIIDGGAWFRTEGMMPQEAVDTRTLTEPVERLLTEGFGVGPWLPAEARLCQAARACAGEFGDTAVLVRGLMAATLEDPVLRADHVTLTCPMGDLLGAPELMTTSAAFFTETQLREGLDLAEYAERLGHESSGQVQRTIRARMLKLKRGAIRGLYGAGCIQGRFVEKHGGHMIFRNEDAHYRGHQSIGCSSGGRASFGVRYRRGGADLVMTPMVGDYRVVRMSQDPADVFTAGELARVIRYAEWIRVVVEETYRRDCVVRNDALATEEAAAVPG